MNENDLRIMRVAIEVAQTARDRQIAACSACLRPVPFQPVTRCTVQLVQFVVGQSCRGAVRVRQAVQQSSCTQRKLLRRCRAVEKAVPLCPAQRRNLFPRPGRERRAF